MHRHDPIAAPGPASTLEGLGKAALFYFNIGILSFKGDGWSEVLWADRSNIDDLTVTALQTHCAFDGNSGLDWTTQAAFVRLDGAGGAAQFGQTPGALFGAIPITGDISAVTSLFVVDPVGACQHNWVWNGTPVFEPSVPEDESSDVFGTGSASSADVAGLLLQGGPQGDSLRGALGDDTLLGDAGNDQLAGHAGNDLLEGGDGHDTIFGGAGDDWIDAGNGADRVVAGSGDDFADGGNGADLLLGKAGADTLSGGAADDVLDGGADNDRLDGGDGLDTLMGGAGSDTLLGGIGRDDLIGGSGSDTMDGGFGADRFFFDRYFGSDRIENFQSGIDALIFEGFPEGPEHVVVTELAAGLWHVDTAAGDLTITATRIDPDLDLVFV